jgi:hypothetical protein
MSLSIQTKKFSMLLNLPHIIEDFLPSDELDKIRRFFWNKKTYFNHGRNEDGSLSQICRAHQLILDKDMDLSWLELRYKQAYLDLLISNSIEEKKSPQLVFEKFYLKFYEENDFYRQHVDISASNLTFLFQFNSEESNAKFSSLNFFEGPKIPYKSNQLIIFNSTIPHSFENELPTKSEKVRKCLIQCLPDVSAVTCR